jgi:hypothetical protein
MVGTPFAKIHWQENLEAPSTERVLLLYPKEGTVAKDTAGLPAKKLFTGDNKMHAKTEGHLWHCYMDKGEIPMQLRQKWTKFSALFKAVESYYDKRNVEVKEE